MYRNKSKTLSTTFDNILSFESYLNTVYEIVTGHRGNIESGFDITGCNSRFKARFLISTTEFFINFSTKYAI